MVDLLPVFVSLVTPLRQRRLQHHINRSKNFDHGPETKRYVAAGTRRCNNVRFWLHFGQDVR